MLDATVPGKEGGADGSEPVSGTVSVTSSVPGSGEPHANSSDTIMANLEFRCGPTNPTPTE